MLNGMSLLKFATPTLARLLTPSQIKKAAEEVFQGLLKAEAGVSRAVELPLTGTPEDVYLFAEIGAYLLKTKADWIVINRVGSGLIVQLKDDWVKHTPEGREVLMRSGRIVQTTDTREILASVPKEG